MKRAHTEVKSRLLLDVVVGESPTILELLARKDQALLIGRNTLLVLYLCLDLVNGVRGLDLEGYRLPREGLDEDLHSSTVTKHCRRIRYYVEDHEKSTHRGEE